MTTQKNETISIEDSENSAEFSAPTSTSWAANRLSLLKFVPLAKIQTWVSPYSRIISLIGCLLLISLLVIFKTRPGLTSPDQVLVDDSWIMSLPTAWQQGYISGRDFAFTYGPLWQLFSLFGNALNGSTSSYDGYAWIRLTWMLAGVGLLGIAVGFIKQLDWKHIFGIFFVFLILNVFFLWPLFRPVTDILNIVLLARIMAISDAKKRLLGVAGTGVFCIATQLITAELGVYTLVSSAVLLTFYSVLAFSKKLAAGKVLLPAKSYLYMLGVLLATYLAGNLLICIGFKLTSPDYSLFDYIRYNLEIFRSYSFTAGSPWSITFLQTLTLVLVGLYSFGYVALNWKKLNTAESYILVGLCLCALIQLKGAMVRSGLNHILRESVPLLFIFLVIGKNWVAAKGIRFGWVGLLLLLLITWPQASLDSLKQLGDWADGKLSLSAKIQQLTVRNPQSAILPAGLVEAVDHNKAILNFPYDNYIGVGLNQRIVGPVFQSYAAFNEALQQKYIADLEREKKSLEIVYGLDGLGTPAVDDVPSVTRSPVIFDYIYRNFEAKYPKIFGKGYLLLQPRTQPVLLKGTDLAFSITKTEGDRLTTIKLNQPASCSLLKISSVLNYPLTTLFGHYAPLGFKFWSQGQPLVESKMVAIEPGKEFSTYLSLMDVAKFQQIFVPDGQSVQAKQWDTLQLYPATSAFLSITPSAVKVTKLECITFGG